ncbi:hypothetical protein SDC9_88514 [bioreactor metagenome]|uniref:Type II secretion system protein G n=1 Tax=bioreactor metagenome TaxID=1076179 RepID=A0A644ZWB5_9ZZZZ
MKKRKTEKRAAFTLVELLVVIVVLAVFAVLLHPLVAASQDDAQVAVCAANLKQLSQMAASYADHWEGYYPHSRITYPKVGKNGADPNENMHWWHQIAPELELLKTSPDLAVDSIMRCPAVSQINFGDEWRYYQVNYSMSEAFWEPVKLSRIANASEVYVFADGNLNPMQNNKFTRDTFNPTTARPNFQAHDGGCNVVSADGSVRRIPPAELNANFDLKYQ